MVLHLLQLCIEIGLHDGLAQDIELHHSPFEMKVLLPVVGGKGDGIPHKLFWLVIIQCTLLKTIVQK